MIKNILINKNNKKGSLLLESLLAVIILSVGIAFIIKAMSNSLRAISSASSYSEAFILADNKMSNILKERFVEEGINEKMRFPYPNDKYGLSMEIFLIDVTDARGLDLEDEDNINQVDLTIFWRSGRKNNRFEINTYVLKSEKL